MYWGWGKAIFLQKEKNEVTDNTGLLLLTTMALNTQ